MPRPRALLMGALLGIIGLSLACRERDRGLEYNARAVGAPRVKPSAGPTPAMRDAGPRWSSTERLRDRLVRRFARLADLPAAAPWGEIARLLRSLRASKRAPGNRPATTTRLTITTFRNPGVPELYGVDYEAPCRGGGRGPFADVEHHLLIGRRGGRLELLTAHRPACGAVGDRTILVRDLLREGTPQVIETYTEEKVSGPDFQEVRVWRATPSGLELLATNRISSPFRYFRVSLEPGAKGRIDLVTTHLGFEREAGTYQGHPCWRYRYHQIRTRHRYDPAQRRFRAEPPSRRLLAYRRALDLTGIDLPGGTCRD